MQTERPSPRYSDIDLWEPADVLDAMIAPLRTDAWVNAELLVRYALDTPCNRWS